MVGLTGSAHPSYAQSATPVATPATPVVLPDLAILPTEQLLLAVAPITEQRLLRFSTTIANVGAAPLELLGEVDGEAGLLRIRQRLTDESGVTEQEVGTFVFDAAHGHWHVDGLVTTELWALGADGAPERLVASTGKTSFCLLDAKRLDRGPVGSPAEPVFRFCLPDRQGLSAGWADRYDALLPGQALEVTGLPDGRYALRTVLDPDGLIADADTANNERIDYVELSGDSARLVPAP